MATITEMRQAGTDLLVQAHPVPEALIAPLNIQQLTQRFDPEIYTLSKDSHLFRFLIALVGDAGTGDLKKKLLFSRLQSYLGSSYFTDLDLIFGNSLLLPRLSSELYLTDPKSQALTVDQWQEVIQKDASYRTRSSTWMKALKYGGTPYGIKLAAEAAAGVECDVVERFEYLDAQRKGDNTVPSVGITISNNEIVVIPQLPDLTQEQKRRIIHLVDVIKPSNSIPTVISGTIPRSTLAASYVSGSSHYFTIQKLVTGLTEISWPSLDASKGFWIEGGVEKEAPNFAFLGRQESVVPITIEEAEASSYHTGNFSEEQQDLFVHLRDTSIPPISYTPQKAIAENPIVLQTNNPWIANNNLTVSPTILIDNHYPLEYFSLVNVSGPSISPTQFWASEEDNSDPHSGTEEWLIFNLGGVKQFNYIDFEISQKPIDIKIEYSNDKINWTEVEASDYVNLSTLHLTYLPSLSNPWLRFEHHFNTVLAQYIRVTFTRRDDIFPLPTSDHIHYSIEVRNTRVLHAIGYLSDILQDENGTYLGDAETDLLGNPFRVQVYSTDFENLTDGNTNTFWQSQPNPTPFAVEYLYFDISENGQPKVLNEIYIDPITNGPTMHIYWSNDDVDWDNKLWTPVNRTYVLQKGMVYLPAPVLAKYIKIEFSNLSATPYSTPDYPSLPPVVYRTYPTWVQNLFETLFPIEIERESILFPFSQLTIDPLTFGFQKEPDKLDTPDRTFPVNLQGVTPTEINAAVSDITGKSRTTSTVENTIQFHSSFMFQEELIGQLDNASALTRFIKINQSTLEPSEIKVEAPTQPPADPDSQTSINLTAAEAEKKRPILYFPFSCRHGYQVLNLEDRPTKIAYIAAIREISFYRRDYSVKWNDPFYIETLDDTFNIQKNDFVQNDWRYVI